MDLTMTLTSPEAARDMAGFIRRAGGNATWDRLAEFLENRSTGRDTFVLHRVFAAPPEVVFSLWTEPDHLVRWLPPAGFRMEILQGKIAEGDGLFFRLTREDAVLFARYDYDTIQAPERLIYRQSFREETGEPPRHPHAPDLPETLVVTVDFVAEGTDATRVRLLLAPVAGAAAELAAFRDLRGSLHQGWSGSFDQLEALLER